MIAVVVFVLLLLGLAMISSELTKNTIMGRSSLVSYKIIWTKNLFFISERLYYISTSGIWKMVDIPLLTADI